VASTGSGERRARKREVGPDAQEIRRALGLLHEPGEVFETRALGGRLRRPLSGYFDDHDAAARVALECVRRGSEGVYVTLNPVNRALLARANNKVIEAQRNASTADKNITRRRWVFIDLDAVRPSGISSTDPEHRAALDKAREIAAWLTLCNWPSPVLADSGNGAHLLYQLDLPADEGGIVNRVLTTLDMLFSDGRVKVDRTTFNPARIVKLYGTPARKGDSTADRPHRLARLLNVPKDLEHVPKGRLEEIAEFAHDQTKPESHAAQAGGSDVRKWLPRWGLEVLREESYGSGVRLILRVCPFGDHRKEAKAAVFINSDGRLGFHCFSDDHAGHGWKELRAKFEPTTGAQPDSGPARAGATPDEPSAPFSEPAHGWPEPPADDAFYGLADEFVRMVRPHTEADPAAVLVHFLVMFGSLVGGGPYRLAGGQRHHLNEYALIIGETKRGRKGTALAEAMRPFEIAALDWFGPRVMGGLSSGEGLIWQVRDPIIKRQSVKERGHHTGAYEEYEDDPGISDKRLMVVETEFSQALKVMAREGNTLSEVLRKAWDGGNLAILSRNSPTRATAPHVSILGHITPDELAKMLDSTSAANGFGNRFLFVCSRRSNFLPWGGSTIDARMPEFARTVTARAEETRKTVEFKFDSSAVALWEQEYPRLSDGGLGLVGALTGRAEAHVIRLACLYAATAGGEMVREPHLRAALSLWAYCERSAQCLFGGRYGDPMMDAIVDALRQRPDGMTMREIDDLFSGHKKASELQARRAQLLRLGRITVIRESTGGRPAERWTLIR